MIVHIGHGSRSSSQHRPRATPHACPVRKKGPLCSQMQEKLGTVRESSRKKENFHHRKSCSSGTKADPPPTAKIPHRPSQLGATQLRCKTASGRPSPPFTRTPGHPPIAATMSNCCNPVVSRTAWQLACLHACRGRFSSTFSLPIFFQRGFHVARRCEARSF